MEAFQHADGYLNVYFTVVDPAGKFQNLRDMHEMCEFTGSRYFSVRVLLRLLTKDS
jgi:DUF1680 family protein